MGLWWVSLLLLASPSSLATTKLDLTMPGVEPKLKDTYLCMAHKLNGSNPLYIVGFEPKSDKSVAHHMLLYGCKTPGFTDRIWNCGEMENKGSQSDFDEAKTCKSGPMILYAWALDAPSLPLPPDVGFKIGGDSGVNYLVLQVHYKNVPPKDHKDTSGMALDTTQTPMPKRAGVYLMGTSGTIPAKSTVYMETACPVETEVLLHPFAYRAHTHTHGKVVSGYRIRDGEWTEIGRVNPRLPQMFYSVTTPGIDVRTLDILAARCTMKNDGKADVQIGATQNDEMCNFYMMYWVDNDVLLEPAYCFSDGPPQESWATSSLGEFMNLDRIPADASTRPDTGETFPETATANNRWTLAEILREGYGPEQRFYYPDGDY